MCNAGRGKKNPETIRKTMGSQISIAGVWLPGSAQVYRTEPRYALQDDLPHSGDLLFFGGGLFFELPLCLRFHCLGAKLASFGLLSTDLLVCFIWPDAVAAVVAALSVAGVQGKRSQSADSEGLADPPVRSTKSRDARKGDARTGKLFGLSGKNR